MRGHRDGLSRIGRRKLLNTNCQRSAIDTLRELAVVKRIGEKIREKIIYHD